MCFHYYVSNLCSWGLIFGGGGENQIVLNEHIGQGARSPYDLNSSYEPFHRTPLARPAPHGSHAFY